MTAAPTMLLKQQWSLWGPCIYTLWVFGEGGASKLEVSQPAHEALTPKFLIAFIPPFLIQQLFNCHFIFAFGFVFGFFFFF